MSEIPFWLMAIRALKAEAGATELNIVKHAKVPADRITDVFAGEARPLKSHLLAIARYLTDEDVLIAQIMADYKRPASLPPYNGIPDKPKALFYLEDLPQTDAQVLAGAMNNLAQAVTDLAAAIHTARLPRDGNQTD